MEHLSADWKKTYLSKLLRPTWKEESQALSSMAVTCERLMMNFSCFWALKIRLIVSIKVVINRLIKLRKSTFLRTKGFKRQASKTPNIRYRKTSKWDQESSTMRPKTSIWTWAPIVCRVWTEAFVMSSSWEWSRNRRSKRLRSSISKNYRMIQIALRVHPSTNSKRTRKTKCKNGKSLRLKT